MPDIGISPRKVAGIIVRAREYDAKVAPFDGAASDEDRENEPDSILEDRASDSTRAEVAEMIADLNVDEQAALVALTWVGRGTYEPEDFAEAVATAQQERINATEDYLLGIPLLSDYLEEGLERMGFSAEAEEDDVM
jgi:hypothetical protein